MSNLDKQTEITLEAATFRRLVSHLRTRPDVQNGDLMKVAGFCRECLSSWFEDAATELGVPVSKADVRALVYGTDEGLELDKHWSIPVSDKHPERCTLDAHCQEHQHGPGCGHEAVQHGDHVDYLVDGRLHHIHGGHCDDHGAIAL